MLKALDEENWLNGKTKATTTTDMNAALYKTKTGTPPFLLSFKIFGKNLHNFLLDFGASSNVIPFSIFKRFGLIPVQTHKKVIQLDKTRVNVIGELEICMYRLDQTHGFKTIWIFRLLISLKCMGCC